MRHHVGVRLDPLEEAEILQPGHDLLARLETIDAVQFLGKLAGTFRQAAQIIFVIDEGNAALLVEHADTCQAVPVADFEIVEVMRRRDLDRARALFRIGIGIGDNGNPASHQRQDHMLADQRGVALVVRIDRDAAVAEHRLGPCGSDHDEAQGILGAEGFCPPRGSANTTDGP